MMRNFANIIKLSLDINLHLLTNGLIPAVEKHAGGRWNEIPI
jgi:hypothetical protein